MVILKCECSDVAMTASMLGQSDTAKQQAFQVSCHSSSDAFSSTADLTALDQHWSVTDVKAWDEAVNRLAEVR